VISEVWQLFGGGLLSWAHVARFHRPRPVQMRQFEPEVILLAIKWYLRFSLSYRDVEELLQDRGISVDHVTL